MEDDDPFSAPAQPPHGIPAPPQAAAAAKPIAFGLIGKHHAATADAGGPGCEVVRTFASGVTYRKVTGNRSWSKIDEFRYRIHWPADASAGAPATLADLARRLAESPKGSDGGASLGEALSAELDACIDAYLAGVGRLHAAKWSQGLVAPGSVAFVAQGGVREAVFPDLGFAWDDTVGEPDWLTEHPGRGFWSEAPGVRQLAWRGAPGDLAVAARIVGFVVLNRVPRDRDFATASPFWTALKDANQGRIASAEALRQALKAAPASEAMRGKTTKGPGPDETREQTGLPLLRVAAAIVAFGVIAAAGYFALAALTSTKPGPRPDDRVVTPPTVAVGLPEPPGVVPKRTADLLAEGGRLAAKYDDLPPGAAERAKLDQDRASFRDRVLARLDEVWEQYGRDGDGRRAAGQLRPLTAQMKQLAAKPPTATGSGALTKEKACIDFAEELLRQLEH